MAAHDHITNNADGNGSEQTHKQASFDWDAQEPVVLQPDADLTGMTFGLWTVIGRTDREGWQCEPFWECRCECGRERTVRGFSLRSQRSMSCGCTKRKDGSRIIHVRQTKSWFKHQLINCDDCGKETPKTSSQTRYCPECSRDRYRMRNRKYARRHPVTPEYSNAQGVKVRSQSRALGAEISLESRWAIEDLLPEPHGLVWLRKFSVPFTVALSKNHHAAMSDKGHVGLRAETTTAREIVAKAAREALFGVSVAENKLWLDFLIEKPDHRGDAINLIDHVSDAIKHTIHLDDRWFCIRRIDWRIVKVEPRILIGIGQESSENVRVCCYCGRLLPFDRFYSSKGMPHGIGRECKECRGKYRRSKVNSPDEELAMPLIEDIGPDAGPDAGRGGGEA